MTRPRTDANCRPDWWRPLCPGYGYSTHPLPRLPKRARFMPSPASCRKTGNGTRFWTWNPVRKGGKRGTAPSLSCEATHQRRAVPGRSPDSQVTAFQTAFPSSKTTVANCSAETLAAYSGATVRELHPLPYWLGFEHLGTNGEIVATAQNRRQENSPLTRTRVRVPRGLLTPETRVKPAVERVANARLLRELHGSVTSMFTKNTGPRRWPGLARCSEATARSQAASPWFD